MTSQPPAAHVPREEEVSTDVQTDVGLELRRKSENGLSFTITVSKVFGHDFKKRIIFKLKYTPKLLTHQNKTKAARTKKSRQIFSVASSRTACRVTGHSCFYCVDVKLAAALCCVVWNQLRKLPPESGVQTTAGAFSLFHDAGGNARAV